MELRADPSALAPERLLVFEVRGPVSTFADAIRKIPGLELIDEEELTSDDDKAPTAYLLVPDLAALRQLESLWRRWQDGKLQRGETPWRDVFALLRDLRPWGPSDRVSDDEAQLLAAEVDGLPDNALVRLEIELVYRNNVGAGTLSENAVLEAVRVLGGRVLTRARIPDIAYHALLAQLSVAAVKLIIARSIESIAGLEPVMHIRPQSLATTIELSETGDVDQRVVNGNLGSPILALLDGVPLAAHSLLAAHVTLDDQFNLEPDAAVAQRIHGTAMASLIIHGDRNENGTTLPRRLHVVPVMGNGDAFPNDRLIVDLIYLAVLAMRDGVTATAPQVLIVNLSLGNGRRPFYGKMSAWARLLDRLAYRFGLLFIVSAGNCLDPFGMPAFATNRAFEDAAPESRAEGTVSAIASVMAERKVISPAETINGLTVGACNVDAVAPADRARARSVIDPYGAIVMANPSSALGPGFAQSVKPDILLPGCREHLRVVKDDGQIFVRPSTAARAAGLKVAAPPVGGRENVDGFTGGTSAAAAIASRTAHRIHDALETAYGDQFLQLPSAQRAALLKALLVHPARWPDAAAVLIKRVIGPPDNRQHVRQKDNIRRFLGFGCVEPDDAVACASDRATFWAVGSLHADKVAEIHVPVPHAMAGQARPHYLCTTVAWFAPTLPGRKSYRSVRLKVLEPDTFGGLRIKSSPNQPDTNQANRGTVFTRCWSGDQAPAVNPDQVLTISVQRDPDQGQEIDETIPFGIAITIAMPGVVQIYDQARARAAIAARAPV